ncbi:MAG TPA: DUF3365 domain-containing protein [Planctomycetaceae bacterium]|nr:DUF3365 domain-containing protein [Planctomycetaceae bacterium]
MKRPTTYALCSLAAAALTAAGLVVSGEAAGKAEPPTTAALERTRNTVRMLDDVYKSAIVLITDKYVHDTDDFPAGAAAVQWFEGITKKGWHEVRLLDATGEPYDDENVARDEFEREGIRQLKAGQPYYEQVVDKGGRAHLRAVTPVPVVMQKCVMCHPHYADARKGEAIGAISYTVKIE